MLETAKLTPWDIFPGRKTENLQFRQKGAQNCRICELFHFALSLKVAIKYIGVLRDIAHAP